MIECNDIVKTYKNGEMETVALKGVTFTIKDGEFVAIMGPSGSGKSTLMHIIGCLDAPSSGTYRLDGHDVSKLSDDELADIRNRKIGFVFQTFNLLPRATVLRNVALPLVYAGIGSEKREKAAAVALSAAAFPEKFWRHLPNQLSGGMTQRVAIARALVNDPSLILADEPTGNLDTQTGEMVLDTFQRLHTEQKRTIVLITHEVYVAEHAERIIQIKDGGIVGDDTVKHRRMANIGIGSVIAMVSIGQGASGQIQSSIEGLGSNLLTVMPGVVQPGRGFVSSGRGSAQTLKNEDADALEGLSGVAFVSPELQRRFQITSQVGNNTNSTVIGATAAYSSVRNVETEQGSFLTEQHNRSMSRVVVLGPTVAQDLFGEGNNPLGKTIRVNKINFKVIGILKAKGGSGFFNPDDTVLVPLSTMQKILAGADYLSTIAISVLDKELMPQVQEQAIFALAEKHRVDPQSPDFSIVSQADILGALTQITTTFTIFLASVAGISLLVGGIGIMNMMLTTVTERTREIGLRKAIGAKRKDITLQFLA
ncbi:MAG: hypothetical protein UX27_C0030G0005, partial [Candidatus Azambacteria bacterium GW2011_GWA2_45_90]